jgi:hypothetical protein
MLTGELPDEFTFEADWSSEPTLCATWSGDGWIVVAAQHGVRAVLARLTPALETAALNVHATGKDAKFHSARPLIVPGHEPALAIRGWSPENAGFDPRSLKLGPAPKWVDRKDRDVTTDVVRLGDSLLLGIGDGVRTHSFAVRRRGKAVSWMTDFEDQMSARKQLFAGDRSGFESIATLGKRVLLTHRYFMRSKPVGHALLAVDPGGKLERVRVEKDKRDTARFGEHDIRWFADTRRGQALLYGGRILEVLDADLKTVARIDGHSLFKRIRPIATDGSGALLWQVRATRRVMSTDARELDPGRLARCLDAIHDASARLLKRTTAGGTPRKPAQDAEGSSRTKRSSLASAKDAGSRSGKMSAIARPPIDLAHVDTPHYVMDRDRLLALETGPLPDRLHAIDNVRRHAEHVLGVASVIAREDPVVLIAARCLAHSLASDVAMHRPAGAEVTVPYGSRSVRLPTVGPPALPQRWLDAWYAALVARDERTLDLLAGFPDADLHPDTEPYETPLRAALKALRVQPSSARSAIERAIELARPPHLRYERAWVTASFRIPIFRTIRALAQRDEADFQASLTAAVAGHKKYWGTPKQRLLIIGMVARAPLALACVAHDLGIPVRAETEYLLPALIERRFG